MSSIRLLLGGDVCPIGRHTTALCGGDLPAVWGDFLPRMQAADLVAVNLECPVIDRPSPIAKTGPVLAGPPQSLAGLVGANVALVSLANNHIMDHGPAGLQSTLEACRRSNLLTFGAGADLGAARRLLVVPIQGLRVAFLAMAEHEWSVASPDTPGANPMDAVGFVRQIQAAKGTFDYLVVYLHAGAEMYPYPTPALQDFCHFLVEQGAGLVLCQHSHCLGCAETYAGGTILYGQGNLLFDFPDRPASWNYGVWVDVRLDSNLRPAVSFLWYRQSVGTQGLSEVPPSELLPLQSAFAARSAELADFSKIRARWAAHCSAQALNVLASALGHGPTLRRLTRRRGVLPLLYSPAVLRDVWNCVRCETHRELLLGVFESVFPASPEAV